MGFQAVVESIAINVKRPLPSSSFSTHAAGGEELVTTAVLSLLLQIFNTRGLVLLPYQVYSKKIGRNFSPIAKEPTISKT